MKKIKQPSIQKIFQIKKEIQSLENQVENLIQDNTNFVQSTSTF